MALKSKKKKVKEAATKVVTPWGMFSYPHLAEPDTGRPNSKGKYCVDLLIKKADWKGNPAAKALKEAILKVGRKFFDDDSLELSDFANPLKDTSKLENYTADDVDERLKDCVLMKVTSAYDFTVVGPDKKQWGKEGIAKIKGGDIGRLVVEVKPYSNDDGGVTCYLTLVQFKQAGKALGQGTAAALALIDEIEVDAEDIDDEDEDEEPAPKKKLKAKKVVEEDEDEDPSEEEDEDFGEPKSKKKSKKKAALSEDEDEDEEPAPKKKSKSSKKKVVDDEEELDNDESDSDEDFDFDE